MTTLAPPLRAAIYTRVSQDASGVARSPKEQEAESRRDCERNGWAVVDVYTDNDRSASRYAGKTRPDYVRLLADIAAGEIDVLVVWEASRLTRDLEAYATLAGACRAAEVRLSYGGKLLDLDNPDDEFTVGLDMLLAQRESGVARKRILRASRANAEAGRPHGRVQLGFRRIYDGHRQFVRQEADPESAPVVVEMFTRLDAGHSLHAIARDLNDRGAPGAPWTPTKVRRTVLSRSYIGTRVHRGQVTVEHAWPALVGDDIFYRVQAILNDPARFHGQDMKVRHLLSGLLVCGRCGERVVFDRIGARRYEVYRCKLAGHVVHRADTLERGIVRLLAARLARPDAIDLLTRRPDNLAGVRAEVKALTALLDDADDALADGAMSPRAHGKLEARKRPRLDELETLLGSTRRETPTPVVLLADLTTPREVAARFARLPMAERRLVVRHLFTDLTLRPAPPSRRRPDLGVRFRWGSTDETVDL